MNYLLVEEHLYTACHRQLPSPTVVEFGEFGVNFPNHQGSYIFRV